MLRKSTPTRSYTVEEFMNLPDDGKKYDLWEGKLEEVPSAKPLHGIVASKLIRKMGNYVEEYKLGVVVSEPPFRPDANKETAIIGDVGFITREHLSISEETDGLLVYTEEIVVYSIIDLMVEIISQENRQHKTDFMRKIRFYQRSGIPLVWAIDAKPRTVEIYHPDDMRPLTLGVDDELDGENIIPGFRLPVRELFKL